MFQQFKQALNPHSSTRLYKKQYYILKTDLTKKVLDIEQQGAHPGRATIYKSWKGDNQQFAIQQVNANGEYRLRCKKGGYLTVADANDNARISLEALNKNSPNQIFKIGKKTKHGRPIYTFCGKVLDVFEESTKDGAIVCQYAYQGQSKKNQHWHLCDAAGDVTNSSSQND